MIKIIVRCLIIISAIFSSCSLVAEEASDAYQIDVIFFENTKGHGLKSEIWPKFVGKLDTRRAIRLGDPNHQLITSVEAPKLLLSEEARALKRSKDQKIIQHLGWIQHLASGTKSIPVYIQTGKNNEEVEAVMDFKTTRNQFNVSFDMIYKLGEQEFRLTRDFKVKKKEVYYIDHPVVGALVVISPLG
jgi:hypothetical protein